MTITAPISVGELIDKITILKIKSERISDPFKLNNIHAELKALRDVECHAAPYSLKLRLMWSDLQSVNEKLWDVLNEIQDHETSGTFGDRFVELSRSVRLLNNERCAVKRQIDDMVGSEIKEEKSYA